MGPITLIAAGLLCITIGAKLAPNPTIKSDSYTLSQIRQVVSAIDKESEVKGIENKIPVLVKGDEQATLYDLNNDEGYLVLGNNYKIFDYQPNIELSEKASMNKLEFNPISRSFTTRGGQYVSVTDETNKQPDVSEANLMQGEFVDYGCGQISSEQLTNYINDKFPGGELDDEYSLPITRHAQRALSVYLKETVDSNGNKKTISEGNCWLCAMYTVFDYLVNDSAYSSIVFNNFPKKWHGDIPYYPQTQEPSTYNWVKQYASDYKAFDNTIGDWAVKEFDGLYISLRAAETSFIINSPIIGLSPNGAAAVMENAAHDNGLTSFDATNDTNFNAYTGTQDFKDFLQSDKPLYFYSNGSTYGNHAMAVSGYKHYKRTVRVLFWDKIEWATFLEIGDGWSVDTMYFDITRYYWENCGSGGFIKYDW